MTDERKMRDTPLLDTDREAMREILGREEFDNMTLDEFGEAIRARIDDMLDLYALLGEGGAPPDRYNS